MARHLAPAFLETLERGGGARKPASNLIPDDFRIDLEAPQVYSSVREPAGPVCSGEPGQVREKAAVAASTGGRSVSVGFLCTFLPRPLRLPDPIGFLARKYRPSRLDDLVGQDVMVRILTNASGDGAHGACVYAVGRARRWQDVDGAHYRESLELLGPRRESRHRAKDRALRNLPAVRGGSGRSFIWIF